MFGNKGKERSQFGNESGIQQPTTQQTQVEDTNADFAKIKEFESMLQNLTGYVQEQAHLTTEIASRVEKMEGESSPMLTQMSDTKRLNVLEQNMLSHQTTIEAIVEAITDLTREFNKIIESSTSTKKGKVKGKHKKEVEEDEENIDDESDLV